MSQFLAAAPDAADQTSALKEGAKEKGLADAANAYSNYRQFSRDNYQNQLSNRSSLYQGLANRMASAYGAQGSPNVSQMSHNPMSLDQTMVGATRGSNAAGGLNNTGFYDADGKWHDPGEYQKGIIDEVGHRNMSDFGHAGVPGQFEGFKGGDLYGSLAPGDRPSSQTPGGSINDINTNNSWAPQQVPQSSGGAPSGGFSFAPRRA